MVNENVSLVISRPILTELCELLTKMPDEESKIISHYTLDKIQPRVISFEEQVRYINAIHLDINEIYKI